jgi:hypothetical protein
VIFFSNIITPPPILKRWSTYTKKNKEKLQESLQIKGEVISLRGENTSTSKILFDVIPFSPPPSYHFKNPFQNH